MKINYKDAIIELDISEGLYSIEVEHLDSDVIYAIHEEFGMNYKSVKSRNQQFYGF